MKEADFQKALSEAESQIHKWDHEYANDFSAVLKAHDAELTTEQKQQLNYEIAASLSVTADTTQQKSIHRLRNNPGYTDDQLKYYFERAKVCKNPVIRQRYFDVLWEKGGKGFNKHDIGVGLVDSSLEIVKILEHDNEFERLDNLNRAIQISVFMEKQGGSNIDKSVAALRAQLGKYAEESKYRYALDLIDTTISFKQLFNVDDLTTCHAICEKAIEHYAKTDINFTLRGAFIERLYNLKKLIDPSSFDSKARAKDLAQNSIDEAERRTDSLMVQQFFLIQAEKIYKDAGLTTEAKGIRKRVEAIGKDDVFEDQFHQFSFEQEIPKELIDTLRDQLTKAPDTTALIALSPNFRPSWSEAEENNRNAENQSLTDFLVTPTTIDDNGMTIAVDNSSAERKGAMRYFQSATEFRVFMAAGLMRDLIGKKVITIKSFEMQFSKLKGIDKDLYDSVKHGLKLFLKGDYYPASLILTTKLEDFMSRLLPAMGIEQYFFESDSRTQSPKTLKQILEDMKPIIGDDLYELFVYALIDKRYHNLRHLVAHGRTSVNDKDNLQRCVRVIQLFGCLLVNVQTKPKAGQ
jgi:hypothetical protein